MPRRSVRVDKETKKLLRRVGYTKLKKAGRKSNPCNPFPDLSTSSTTSLSNRVDSNGFLKSIDDYRWRRDRAETKETIEEIERKKKSISIPFNKSAPMYITPKSDAKDFGRK